MASTVEILINGRDNASGVIRGVGGALHELSSKVTSAGTQLMGAGAAMSVVSAPLIGIGVAALKTAMDYEASMNMLQTTSGATGEQMGKLAALATQLGADMTLPATSAADAGTAMAELGRSGMSVNDIMAASRGVMQLAAAGEMEAADAAKIVASSLAMFGLEGSKANVVVDLLAGAANKSLADIDGMAMSLQMFGTVANMSNMKVEDATTGITLLAQAGIQGSDAGTSLKTMMLSLMAPTKEAAGQMAALGIEVRNAATGEMLPMEQIIANFNKALGEGATQTISFGGATSAMASAAQSAQGKLITLDRAIVVAEAHTGMSADTMRNSIAAYAAANGSMEGFGRTLGGNTFELYKAVAAQDAAKAKIAEYGAAQGTAGTKVVALGDAQRDAAMKTIFGTDAIRAGTIVMDGGTAAWTAMKDSITAGGEAAKLAETKSRGLAGALEGMKSNIETLLLTALSPFMQTISATGTQMGPIEVIVRKVAEKFAEITTVLQNANPEILKVGLTIGGMAAAAGPVLLILGAIVTAIGTLMSPIGIVIAGVFALALAFATNFGGIRDAIMPIIEGIISAGQGLVTWFQTVLPGAIANLQTTWGPAWQTIRDTVENVFSWIQTIITQVMTIIEGIIETHKAKVSTMGATWDTIRGTIEAVILAVQSIVESIFSAISVFLARNGEDIKSFVGDAWTKVETIISLAAQLIDTTIRPIFEGIASFLATHGAEIQAVLSAAWDIIKGVISTALTLIEGIIKVGLAIVKGDWEGAWNIIKETAATIWETIKSTIQSVAEKIGPILAQIWDNIKAAAAEKWEAMKVSVAEKIEAIKAAAAEKWEAIKASVAQKWDDIKAAIAEKIASIVENVLTWLDNTLYDIENFDLKAAASKFFNTVILGIAEKIEDAINRVGIWLSNTWEKISTFDLKGAASTTFSTVIAGLAAKITEALTKVGTWLTDVFTKINKFDLLGAAVTLFQTVVAGITKKALDIVKSVYIFLDNIHTSISKYTFKSATLTSLQTVVLGIIAKAADILVAVGSFLQDMYDAITEFSLKEAAWDLIGGFIEGILDKVEAVKNAIVSLINQAVTAAKDALGIGSPSRVFIEIGEAISTGAAVGVANKGPMLAEAIGDALSATEQEAVTKSASIIEPIQAIADAIGRLAAVDIPTDLAPQMQNLTGAIRTIVTALRELAEYFAFTPNNGLDSAKAVLDALSPVFEKIGSATDAIAKIATVAGVNITGASQIIIAMVEEMVLALAWLSTRLTPEVLDQAGSQAEALIKAMSPWAAASSAVQAVADVAGVRVEGAARQLIAMVENMVLALDALINALPEGVLANVAAQAETLTAALSPWAAAASAVQAIADVAGTRIETAAQRLIWMVEKLIGGISWLINYLTPGMLEQAAAQAGSIVTALSPWAAAAEAVQAIADVAGTRIEGAAQRLIWMVEGLMRGINWLISYLSPGVLSQAAAQAGNIVTALSPWTAAASAVQAIADVAGIRIESAAQRLIWMTEGLMRGISWLVNYLTPGLLEQASAQAGKIVTALSPWTAAAEAVQAIADVAGIRIEATALRLIWMVEGLMRGINWLIDYLSPGLLEQASAQAGNVVAALSPWTAAADAVKAIADVAGVRIEEAAQRLVWMVEGLMRGMNWLIDYLSPGLLQAVAAQAGSIVTALSPWAAAASAVQAIADVAGVAIDDAIASLATTISVLIAALQEVAADFTADGLAAATAFATAAGTVGGAIKNAVEGIKALMGFSGAIIPEALNQFKIAVWMMVTGLLEVAAGFSADGLAAATAFATAAGTVGGAVKNAVEGIKALMAFSGAIIPEALNQFKVAVWMMVTGLQEVAAGFSADGLTAAQAFATSAGTIGGAVKNAIEGVKALMEFAGTIGEVAITDFKTAVNKMVSLLEDASGDFDADGLAAATAFAVAAGTIGGAIKNAVEGIKGLMEFSGAIGQDAVDNFLTAVRIMVSVMYEASFTFETTGLSAATAFATAAGTIGGAIKNAIEGIKALLAFTGVIGETALTKFKAAVNKMVTTMLEASALFSADGIKAAVAFAVALGTISGVIKTSSDAIASILGQSGTLGEAAMDRFLGNVRMMIAKLAVANDELATIATDEAERFVARIREILQTIRDLFPSSPAAAGPWTSAPDASGLMQKFGASIVAGLADLMPKIETAINSVINIFNTLSTVQLPDSLVGAFDHLMTLVEEIVLRFRNVVSRIGPWSTEWAGKLADTMGKIGTNVQAFVTGVQLLATYTSALTTGALDAFVSDLEMVMGRFSAAVDAMGGAVIGQAMVLGESMTTIVGGIKVAIDALVALSEYTSASDIVGRIQDFVGDLTLLVSLMVAGLSNFSKDALLAMARAAEATKSIKSIVDIVKPGIEALTALATYISSTATSTVGSFVADLLWMVSVLVAGLSAFSDDTMEAFERAAEAASSIKGMIDVVKPGIEALNAMATYVGSTGVSAVNTFVSDLLWMVAILVGGLSSFSDDTLEAFASAAKASESIKKIVDVVKPGIEALNAMATYVSSTITSVISAFVGDLLWMVAILVGGLGSFSDDALEAFASAAEAAASIKGMVDVVKPGIEALTTLAEYVGAVDLLPKVTAFITDLLTLSAALVEGLSTFGEDALEAMASAAEAAVSMKKVADVVKPGIEALTALATYVSSVTGALVDTFIADLLLLATALLAGLSMFGEEALEAMASAAEAASSIKSVVDIIKPGIEALMALPNYASVADLPARIDAFIADLLQIVNALVVGLSAFSDDAMEAIARAGDASKSIKSVVDIIKPAIDGLVALASYTSTVSDAAITSFVADVLRIVQTMVAAVADLATEGLSTASAFANTAGSIGKSIKDVVEGFASLALYGGLDRTILDVFIADMVYVVGKIVAAASLFTEEGLTAAQQFAATAKTVGDAVASGLEALVGKNGALMYWKVPRENIDLLVADLAYLIQKVGDARALMQDTVLEDAVALSAAMDKVGEAIRSGVEALLKGVKVGDVMRFISDYTATPRDKIDLLLNDMRYIIDKVVAMSGDLSSRGLEYAIKFGEAGQALSKALKDGFAAAGAAIESGAGASIADDMAILMLGVIDAVASLIVEFNTLSASAFDFGSNWVLAIVDGINAALPTLTAALNSVRGLFPASPADYGPWRTLPDGQAVGEGFATGLTDGLLGGQSPLLGALGLLRGAMTMSGTGGLQPAYASGGGTNNNTVNFTGPVNVRNEQDIQQLANAVGDVLARQADINRRSGYRF